MMNPDGIFRGLWCIDNETGDRVLVNLDTNQIILKSRDGKIVYPEAPATESNMKSETV
jgi:hypothetical protein